MDDNFAQTKNFRYLDDLIHGGLKEISLDCDIVLDDDEEDEYQWGIHIDVEPHATDEWKNGDSDIRTKIFQNYTIVLENCRKAINKYRGQTNLIQPFK